MTTQASSAIEETSETSIDKSKRRVRAMFSSIASKYDFLNHLLSMNFDRRWRRYVAKSVNLKPGETILDCCTGTADLALEFCRQTEGTSRIVATDFCHEMLTLGESKTKRKEVAHVVSLIEADTLDLPFQDNVFDLVSIAFGLRNVVKTIDALDEMIRVLKPGGRLAILEFSKPQAPVLSHLYLSFFRHLLPKIGQTVMPNQFQAYSYLPETVLQFPDGQAMVNLLESRQLISVDVRPLTFGIASFYLGYKSQEEAVG